MDFFEFPFLASYVLSYEFKHIHTSIFQKMQIDNTLYNVSLKWMAVCEKKLLNSLNGKNVAGRWP